MDIGTNVKFVTSAPKPALRQGTIIQDEGNGWVQVAVWTTQVLGQPVQRHDTPRHFTIQASELVAS